MQDNGNKNKNDGVYGMKRTPSENGYKNSFYKGPFESNPEKKKKGFFAAIKRIFFSIY